MGTNDHLCGTGFKEKIAETVVYYKNEEDSSRNKCFLVNTTEEGTTVLRRGCTIPDYEFKDVNHFRVCEELFLTGKCDE